MRTIASAMVEARPVGIARALVGVTILLHLFEVHGIMSEVLESPVSIPYAAWIPKPPSSVIVWATAAWALFGVMFAAGFKTRLSAVLLTVVMSSVLMFDQQMFSNHSSFSIMVVGLFALTDSGAAFSIDSLSEGEQETIPAWPVFLIGLQLSALYFFGAVSKLNASFLSGEVLQQNVRAGLPFPTWLLTVGGWSAIAVEIAIAVALWFPRWRRQVFVTGLLLHAGMVFTLNPSIANPLQVFTMICLSLYLLPRRAVRSAIPMMNQPAPCFGELPTPRRSAPSHPM